METKNDTLQNWTNDLEKEIKSSNLLNFDIESNDVIKIMKDDFISLFNHSLEGNVSTICKLDNFLSLSQAIASYQKDHDVIGNEIFTSLNEKEQQTRLKSIKEKSDYSIENTSLTNAYLCFGVMKYNLDVFAAASKQAPLVFLPIILEYNNELDTYSIKGIKGEIYLNNVLFARVKKIRKVDLSYPIDSSFSIGEFLYYISIKIQTLNWNVSNQVYISNFDLFSYDTYVDIKNNKDKILSQDIIKKISYFNSQFYNFSSQNKVQLDSKFLSVIDMDNDEYDILKRVSARENLFIRANDLDAKIHLTSNTILSYLLNNFKTLVVYGNYNEKNELLKRIESEGYSSYACDLDSVILDKNELLADVVNYDTYLLPYRKAKDNVISDDLQKYYDYKNNYKKLTNSLRTRNNPLNMSLNRLINEYYFLDELPLINIHINEPNKFTNDELKRHLDFVNKFTQSIIKLNTKIEDHPFYGFKHDIMKKEHFNELKKHVTIVSSIMHDIDTLLQLGVKRYLYPRPQNLKEFKALLNILAFIDEYQNKKEWINDPLLKENFNALCEIRTRIEKSNLEKKRLINDYRRNILFIKEDLIKEYKETQSPKLKNKIRKLLGKQVPLDKVDGIVEELNAYYQEIASIKEESNKYDPDLIQMMHDNELDKLSNIINQIYLFRTSLNSIKENNNFDVLPILNDHDTNRIVHRKALQNAYNRLLESTKIIQSYFDEEKYAFDTYSFKEYEVKTTNMATHFSSINDYLDFYKLLIDTNEFIYNLGNELIKYNPTEHRNIFLKRFYYDLINERIISNPLLKEHTREKIYHELSSFSSSDDKRKDMIKNIISNNIDTYLRGKLLHLKHEESDKIYQLFSKKIRPINIEFITENVKESLYNLKPCMLCSYRAVAKYLSNSIYKYDLVIILGQKDMMMRDILPSLSHADNVIVFDEEYLSQDPRNSTIKVDSLDNSLLNNAKNAYYISTYTSDMRNIVTHNSPLDVNIKKHIANVLVSHGFEIHIDYQIKNYIIDILVRIPNAKNIIAIELNHLPYNSPEDANKSFKLEDKIISNFGFTPYRIFTSSYFFNEEIENVKLIDFIVKNSDIIATPEKSKKQMLVMDYLFKEFKDPRIVYYQLGKNNLELTDIISKIIDECAPISTHELQLVISKNPKEAIKHLVKENVIFIEDNFIYKKDSPIEFRRINRNENFLRPIETVSKKEIYDAIYKIIKHQGSIEQDVLIKMILLSLGHKKMRKESYTMITDCIEFLLDKKIIFNNDNSLYCDL